MVVKSRNMRWVGYVAHNEKTRNIKKTDKINYTTTQSDTTV